ncbi:MAG: hypothetical protein ACRCW1_00565 [Anaerotignaceae bacterium]
MLIKCNQCEHVFVQEEIEILYEIEYCPNCNETGVLMDIDPDETEGLILSEMAQDEIENGGDW